jgi:hypothetical protein
MNAATQMQDWSRERLADPADDLYYAVLFSPQSQRDNVRAVAALFVELEATVTRFRDMHVARTKLAWWRDEIERLAAGNAAHPVTRVLAGATTPATAGTALGDLITGMELILLEGPATDLATARMQAERGGARLAGVLDALFVRDLPRGDSRMELGVAIGLARQLDRPGLESTARKEVALTARDMLASLHATAEAAPAPLAVLAALAWRTAAGRETGRRRADPARAYTAWRAARRHMPRKMSRIRA